MRLLGKKKIIDFGRLHADARPALETWAAMVDEAKWHKPPDIRGFFGSASFLGDNRVVFNIKGTKYRLDTKVDYIGQTVLVKRIGTHAEYDKWKF